MLALLLSAADGSAALRGRLVPDRKADLRELVVWIDEGATLKAIAGEPQEATLFQQDEEFSSKVLAIRAGSSVRFVSRDKNSLHNVFSSDPRNPFEVGLYRGKVRIAGSKKRKKKGKKPEPIVVFREPGLQRVFCNVHPDMESEVYVFEHGYYAIPDEKGEFSLPWSGPGAVRVVIDGPRLAEPRRVLVASDTLEGTLEIPLKLTRYPKITWHTRKDGSAYAEPGRRP